MPCGADRVARTPTGPWCVPSRCHMAATSTGSALVSASLDRRQEQWQAPAMHTESGGMSGSTPLTRGVAASCGLALLVFGLHEEWFAGCTYVRRYVSDAWIARSLGEMLLIFAVASRSQGLRGLSRVVLLLWTAKLVAGAWMTATVVGAAWCFARDSWLFRPAIFWADGLRASLWSHGWFDALTLVPKQTPLSLKWWAESLASACFCGLIASWARHRDGRLCLVVAVAWLLALGLASMWDLVPSLASGPPYRSSACEHLRIAIMGAGAGVNLMMVHVLARSRTS